MTTPEKSLSEMFAEINADPVRRARVANIRAEMQAEIGRWNSLPRFFADYTHIGWGTHFTRSTLKEERARLELGGHVIVEGDSVSDREGVIVALSEDKREVTVELLPYDPPGQ